MRLYVVEPLGQGGLIHYSYHLCRAMSRAGHDVTLVTSELYELENLPHEFKLERRMRLWDARRKSANGVMRKVQRAWRGVRYITEWFRLVNYLSREKPDVVLLGEIRFTFERYFISMLKRRGIRLADIVHDVRRYDTSKKAASIVQDDSATIEQYNQIYGLFDALLVHDRNNYDLFLSLYNIPAERVHEITIGSDEIMLETPTTHTPDSIKQMLNLPPDVPIILFFGTIAKYKGVEDLIQAFPKVAQHSNAHLLIAGYPAKDIDPDALQAQAKALSIENRITWMLDYVPNDQIVPMVRMSQFVVLPYRAISQSAIVHNAYSCGRAVVATRMGGLANVVEDGESGILVEPENTEALADAMLEMVNNPERTERMGQRAGELARTRYSWTYAASLVTKALESL